MPDLKKMRLEGLRELARKVLGPGHARKTRAELVAALEAAGAGAPPPGPRATGSARSAGRQGAPAREPGGRARTPGRSGTAGGAGKGGKVATIGEKVARAAKGASRKAGAAAARAGKAAAGVRKVAASAAAGAREGKAPAPARARKPGKVARAVATAAGAAGGLAAARKAAKARRARATGGPAEGPDPDGYFVARVRGEDALRDAPHSMAEATSDRWSEGQETTGGAVYDERLGELAWGYGDDAFAALPRDPRTLFLYWDWSQDTLARAFEGLDRPRTQLWVFAREGEGWERVRVLEFALESRGFYVHDLAPGRLYRAEIHALDRAGRERLVASPSNECALPPEGPSPVIDDRFIRLPWELVLGRLLGPGHAGVPFADDIRAQLARLSDWSRFSGSTWGSSAGGMGGRPFSPVSGPSSPSSPFGGVGR